MTIVPYIIITVRQEKWNTTAGQEHSKYLWDPTLLPESLLPLMRFFEESGYIS
jgi:hypothetical protein